MRVGDTYVMNDIPLHLTVLSNARLGGPASRFVGEVQRVAADFQPLVARALSFELFGPNADIPVTEVTVGQDLRRLHAALIGAVRRQGGGAVEPAYWEAGYRAHVTKTQRGSGVEPGAELQLERLALLDCTEPTRRVIWAASLGSPAVA